MIRNESLLIKVGDIVATNFTDAQVVLSFEDVASTFSLSVWDKWSNLGNSQIAKGICPYEEDDEIQISANGESLLVGILERPEFGYDATKFWVKLSGKSIPGQIMRASATYPGGSWKNKTMTEIANDLCKIIGVKVLVHESLIQDKLFNETFPNFTIEPGEMVFDTIGRLAKMRGAMMTTKVGDRQLLLTRASDQIISGQIRGRVFPVDNASRQSNTSLRHSHYFVRGQTAGSDKWFGDLAAKGGATVTDADVERYCPLVMVSDAHGGRAALQRIAERERNVRVGMSKRVNYTMFGWRGPDNKIWKPNVNIPVIDPWLQIEDTLLIARVTLMLGNESGFRTGLELCHKNAYIPEIPPKKRAKRGRKGREKLPLW